MKPVPDNAHCFKHAHSHRQDQECPYCVIESRLKRVEERLNRLDQFDLPKRKPITNVELSLPVIAYADASPVDRSQQVLTNVSPVPVDRSHVQDRGDGQQKGYVVLSAEERAKGFVRPVRQSYIHKPCGVVTHMGLALAETYARDPEFYSGTFCCGCGKHFPVGKDGEFLWDDGSGEKVGT